MDDFIGIQRRIYHNEEKAFAELYTLLYKRLLHFAKTLVKLQEVAADLVEDVFVKLWYKRAEILKIENLSVYLYVAVKNSSLNYLSQSAKQISEAPFDHVEVEIGPITGNDPCTIFISNEMIRRLNQVTNALPPRCKIIFKLVREDGLSYKEVSQILNISINTIDAQMAIAVKKICLALNIQKSSNQK